MTATRLVAAVVLVLSLAPGAHAQQSPTPGAVQRSLDRAVAPSLQRETPPEIEQQAPPDQTAVPAGGPRFLVKRFTFRGNALYTEAQLRAEIADREGQQLTLAEIYAVADRLTDFYHARGHSLAVVTVPAQQVAAGNVLLEVVEGRVGAILFNGNDRYSDDFLRARLTGVAPGSVIRFDTLEHELLMLNDLPGLTVRSVIQPGADYGTSDLLLNMAEKPYDGRLALDNFGRRELGEWRVSGNFSLNNPSGRGDVLLFGLTHTESGLLTSASAGYNLPVGDRGGRLGAVVSRAEYDVGNLPASLGGTSDTYSIGYSEPLLRSRNRNLFFDVGLTYLDPEQEGLLAGPIDAALGFLDAGLAYQQIGANNAQTAVAARIQTNFSKARTRADGTLDNGQRLRLELSASHEQPLRPGWALFGRGLLVYSPDELNDLTKYSLGGPSSVRAYLVTEVSGDSGAEASAELRHYFLARRGLPGVARLFADAGWVKCRNVACVDGDSESSRTGWGLGLTLYPADRYTVELQWAHHLDAHEAADGNENGRFWVFLSADF